MTTTDDDARTRELRAADTPELPGATASAAPEAGARPEARRRSPGVRVRILATVLGLAALGMAGAGVTTVVLQRQAFDANVDAMLRTEVDEFRALADPESVTSETGDPPPVEPQPPVRFENVQELLRAVLEKQAPDRDEAFLSMIDGRSHLVKYGESRIRLDQQPALVRQIAALPPEAPTVLREADTTAGRVRYAVVQVRVRDLPEQGSYVVAVALDRGYGEVEATARRYALVAAGSLAILGLVGWLVAGRLLQPLRALRTTAAQISSSDLSGRIPVTGSHDVSDLAQTFNGMLDRLEASFGAQRQFLDDAGHELRTPVTVIRGHLELLDPGDPADVAETRALLLDEADRMSRLVEDLILLAKARRPDFLHPLAVDLERLTADVLEKARGLADREWQLDEAARQVVVADPQRLTQALLQLADNAVKHTRRGDVVAIGSARIYGVTSLWVRDTGPGVAPADAARIFERFGRAEHGARVEGTGLGLAIVTAIAEAHGGSVAVERPHGGGALFRLTLGTPPAEEETL